MRKARRTRYDLYADVLAAVERLGPCGLTRVSYAAGLPVDRAKRLVLKLVRAGFLAVEEIEGRRFYYLTSRGAAFLELYRRLREMVEAIEAAWGEHP